MTWFRIDDSFYDHPKVHDASDASIALWLKAGTWSARNLTDGFVPSTMLAKMSASPKTAAAELCARGLWMRTRGGFQFHDWQKYQPTREAVEKERKAKAERQRRWLEAKSRRVSRPSQDASIDASKDDAHPRPARTTAGRGEPAPSAAAVRASRNGPPSAARDRPPWCGTCDERTRQVEIDDNGTPAPCPHCHRNAPSPAW